MKFQAAAMSRANVPEAERPDFCLYVDEFQNFITDVFATILSESRKYKLSLNITNEGTFFSVANKNLKSLRDSNKLSLPWVAFIALLFLFLGPS